MKITRILAAALLILMAAVLHMTAQGPPGVPATPAGGRGGSGRGGGGGGLGGGYNPRPRADAAQIERGRGLYSVNCTFCHGIDARGGEGGPNLLRSQLVLNDVVGEIIAPVVQEGRPDRGMPKFNFTTAQIADIAAFIHGVSNVGGRDPSRSTPPTIVTGNAKAGEAYFQKTCASCHSVTGNLKGIATRITDAKALQQNWLMPGGGGGFGALPGTGAASPKTVTVTLPSGEKAEGRLVRIDDFIVTIGAADQTTRTFARKGDVPKVEVHDPLMPHKRLLATYKDSDIHDLTAYLVTIK